jgi:ribonucleoside-diphosphate reductase alpha chain
MTAGGPKPSQGTGTNGKNGHGPHFGSSNGSSNGHGKKVTQEVSAATQLTTAVAERAESASLGTSRQFAMFQEDAPSCDNCGAITVRNGNCYLCHNCGASMGCS